VGSALMVSSSTRTATLSPVAIPLGKRLLDVALAGVGLAASSPLWALLAAAIKWEDGGPVFFSQERAGEGGRVFRVWKFRSMIPDAEKHVGAIQASDGDPRVTRIGRIMRATAMDELPQLWSIFVGDMSFVGPRALRPGEIEVLGSGQLEALEDVPGYAHRARVRPGLTGVAQIASNSVEPVPPSPPSASTGILRRLVLAQSTLSCASIFLARKSWSAPRTAPAPVNSAATRGISASTAT